MDNGSFAGSRGRFAPRSAWAGALACLFAVAFLAVLLLPTGAWASTYQSITVSVPVSGPGTYVAQAQDGAPAPGDGTVRAQDGAFTLTFDEPGTYTYTVSDASDSSVQARTLTVYVYDNQDDSGGLETVAVATLDGKKVDLDYSAKDNPGGGGSGGSGGSGKAGSGTPGASGQAAQGATSASGVKTGDDGAVPFWFAFCLACASAACALAAYERKGDSK